MSVRVSWTRRLSVSFTTFLTYPPASSRVAARLKDAHERVNPGRYDEIAMLALTQETPSRVVDRVLRYRDDKPPTEADTIDTVRAIWERAN